MRSYVPILLFAAGTRAELGPPIAVPGSDLLAAWDLVVSETRCPFQCFVDATNKLKTCDEGFIKPFCASISNPTNRAELRECVANCGASAKTAQFVDLFMDNIVCGKANAG
ncbi:hypothetical protein NOR_00732 [Metarhizium rileyi]|uniref:Uncharacterized protein n=1 Tax=Metarhizium rileyi (strain RCEF 4871) TaxID=1649241 RepID=A0A167JHS4_METRR|nr:hypothetical protein NOR_00732 [Metarhizium rileyi RCEF 4871]TWU73139.1 hypothetical protein ED733_001856 [Metarhizium rileyi]